MQLFTNKEDSSEGKYYNYHRCILRLRVRRPQKRSSFEKIAAQVVKAEFFFFVKSIRKLHSWTYILLQAKHRVFLRYGIANNKYFLTTRASRSVS